MQQAVWGMLYKYFSTESLALGHPWSAGDIKILHIQGKNENMMPFGQYSQFKICWSPGQGMPCVAFLDLWKLISVLASYKRILKHNLKLFHWRPLKRFILKKLFSLKLASHQWNFHGPFWFSQPHLGQFYVKWHDTIQRIAEKRLDIYLCFGLLRRKIFLLRRNRHVFKKALHKNLAL